MFEAENKIVPGDERKTSMLQGFRMNEVVNQHLPDKQLSTAPRVLMAILAKQKEAVLPFYLDCIEALDYPKDAILLYIRTNNNTDRTVSLLKEWADRVGPHYAMVLWDDSDVVEQVQNFGVHEWNPIRFRVLGAIRQESMHAALRTGCDYYFVADVDNFLRPSTLRDLVALQLPIVGPLLLHVDADNPYSNYHAKADPNGYYLECEEYHWLHQQRVRGVVEVDVIHCTYVVRSDAIPHLVYDDKTNRYEYVVFSHSARRNNIPQYLDNRKIYGYLTLDERPETAMSLLGAEIVRARQSQQQSLGSR